MSERKVENVTRSKRNKLLKFLRIKNSVVYRILIFVIRQMFPVLCCICKAPGREICLSCWRRCSKRIYDNRCTRCLETLNIGEISAICSTCSALSPHLSLYLYELMPETLALYRCACLGNRSGEQSFSKAALRALILNQCSIDRIIFSSKDIERNIVESIARYLKVPCEKRSWYRKRKALDSAENICILSIYPFNRRVREEIFSQVPDNAIFMSLFPLAH